MSGALLHATPCLALHFVPSFYRCALSAVHGASWRIGAIVVRCCLIRTNIFSLRCLAKSCQRAARPPVMCPFAATSNRATKLPINFCRLPRPAIIGLSAPGCSIIGSPPLEKSPLGRQFNPP